MSNLTAQTDSLGNATNYEYDDFDRLSKIIYPAATGATQLEERIEYDAVGNVKKRIDTANRETSYDYDTANHLIKTTDADLKQTQFQYNARSQMTKVTDALNQVYNFSYDALGRQLSQTRAGSTMSYEYDAVGNRTKRTDYLNQITDYGYDNLNRLTTLTYPDTTENVALTYDVISRLTKATKNNQDVNFGYDNRNRMKTTTDVFGKIVASVYDGASNRTALKLDGTNFSTYVYDIANRLTKITNSADAKAVNYTYDIKTDTAGTTQYIWDYENRLKQVILPNSESVVYKYDALGRRSERNLSDGTWTHFTCDGLDVMLDQNSDGTSVTYLNGLGVDNKIRQTVNGQAQYFLTDHLGSTNGLADSSGNLIASTSYDSFGNATNSNFPTRYQYTGREFDNFTGLHYYRARWYDAQLGRFISEDPIGFRGGDVNLFGYVANRPLRFVDPFGLDDADRIYEETYYPCGYIKWYRDKGIGDIWQKAVKEPDSQPENFRCGPGYFAPHSFIPQHPLGYKFKETGCFNHDICYGACGKKKAACDKAILRDLQNECMSKGNVFQKLGCLFTARVYYDAVDLFGDK